MNTMMIGFGMILIPTIAAMSLAVGMLLRLMSEAMIEAYRGRNVIEFLAVLLAWSFIIGIALVLIGSV